MGLFKKQSKVEATQVPPLFEIRIGEHISTDNRRYLFFSFYVNGDFYMQSNNLVTAESGELAKIKGGDSFILAEVPDL